MEFPNVIGPEWLRVKWEEVNDNIDEAIKGEGVVFENNMFLCFSCKEPIKQVIAHQTDVIVDEVLVLDTTSTATFNDSIEDGWFYVDDVVNKEVFNTEFLCDECASPLSIIDEACVLFMVKWNIMLESLEGPKEFVHKNSKR